MTKGATVNAVAPSAATIDTLRTSRDYEYYYRDLRTSSPRAYHTAATALRVRKSRKRSDKILQPPIDDTGLASQPDNHRPDEERPHEPDAEALDDEEKKEAKKGSVDDSIRRYLHEIGQVKLLDADLEVDLGRDIAKLVFLENISAKLKADTGMDPTVAEWAAAVGIDVGRLRRLLRRGMRAKEHMVAANLRLVVSIAKKYLNRGLSFQDLIQEGSMGLIRGAEKFDADKGFKFSTYATWWIRQAITRAISDQSRTIRLPVHVNDTLNSVRKMTKILSNELNRAPTDAEIAARMRIPLEKLRFVVKSSRGTISLETPLSKEAGTDSVATLGSFIVWDGDSPEDTAVKTSLREDLENVLKTLSPRERDVVRMRYGFDDGRMKTLEEIGSIFAVTRERIRQIEAKALRKLRHPNRNAVLREYVYEE